MTATEVRQRRAIDHRPARRAQTLLENRVRVWASHRVHRVEAHTEVRPCQLFGNQVKIEQRFEQFGVVRNRVDDADDHRTNTRFAEATEIDICRIGNPVRRNGLGPGKHAIGKNFVGRPAIAQIVLETKVTLGPARVVTRRENDAAERLALADHRAGCRRRQDTITPDQYPAKPCGRRHAKDRLNRHIIEVASVTAENQRLPALTFEVIEDALNVVFKITWLAEDFDFLAQT